MYHAMMKRVARWAFERLNAGDYEALLARCKDDITHSFAGNHALGGTRHSVHAFRRWFERLFTLFQRLEFSIESIAVSGGPAHTTISVEWVDRATPPDGVPYENRGVHVLAVEWGKLAAIRAYLDTQIVVETCDRLAASGIEEAAAPPIED